jgi:hypothetical protein
MQLRLPATRLMWRTALVKSIYRSTLIYQFNVGRNSIYLFFFCDVRRFGNVFCAVRAFSVNLGVVFSLFFIRFIRRSDCVTCTCFCISDGMSAITFCTGIMGTNNTGNKRVERPLVSKVLFMILCITLQVIEHANDCILSNFQDITISTKSNS